jgi:hypothetical protein
MVEPSISNIIKILADASANQQVVNASTLVFNLRRIGLFVSIVLIVGIIFLFVKLKNLSKLAQAVKQSIQKPKINDKIIKRFFESIYHKIQDNNSLMNKLVLAETENYFDEVLKEIGFQGKSLSDKLDNIQEQFLPNLEQIKIAHNQVQNILDQENYQLGKEETNNIVLIYKQGIENLIKL